MLAMGAGLAKKGIRPDVIITSQAVRARESSEILAKKLGLDPDAIQVHEDIFEAERSELLRVVHSFDDSYQTVLLMGHNPGISALYKVLTDPKVPGFSTSCMAVIDLDVDHWSDSNFKNAEALDYLKPQDFTGDSFGPWQQIVMWGRQRVQKIELFAVFIIGLLLFIGLIFMVMNHSTIRLDRSSISKQGLMER